MQPRGVLAVAAEGRFRRAYRWLRAEEEGLGPDGRTHLVLGRLGTLCVVLGVLGYMGANLAVGYYALMALHITAVLGLVANVAAYAWHRRPAVVSGVLGGIAIVGLTTAVAISRNLAVVLPWWGLLPLAAAFAVRTRSQACVWMLCIAATLALHLFLADPTRFHLRNPEISLLICVADYGVVVASYILARGHYRAEAERAEAKAEELGGLLPVCAYCKQIRDDEGYWHQVEAYLARHTGASLTHGVCPTCLDRLAADLEGRDAPGPSTQPPIAPARAERTPRWATPEPADPLAERSLGGVGQWLGRTPPDLGPEDATRLLVARAGSLLIMSSLLLYAAADAASGSVELIVPYAGTAVLLGANLLAYRLIRRIDVLVLGLGVFTLAGETALVALSRNLGLVQPWWGLLPVAGALLTRGAWQAAGWAVLCAVAMAAHLRLSEDAACRLPTPWLTLVLVMAAYGTLAATYVATRERIRARAEQAEAAAAELRALLPICAYCTQVRDDEGYWHQVEVYLTHHTGADLTHSVCPTCLERLQEEIRAASRAAAGGYP